MNFIKTYHFVRVTFVCVSLAVLFQNCNGTRFIASDLTGLQSKGNGEGYSGKPDGTYYRLIPDFSCQQKEAPAAKIEVTSSVVTLTENKKLMCGSTSQQLTETQLDRSVFQNDLIGYEEGIFQGAATEPTKIPANLVEIWCKDQDAQAAIETITHFDRVQNLAVTRVYYGPAGGLVRSDFVVARTLAATTVTVTNDNDFSLVVHRDQPAAVAGLFNAHLDVVVNGEKVVRPIACRLGGSLDPKIWPALQIVDFKVNQFKLANDLGTLAYTSLSANGKLNLYGGASNGLVQTQLSPAVVTSGVFNFLFTPDSKSLVYVGDARVASFREVFKVDLSTGASNLLSRPLTNAFQSVFPPLAFSGDGQSVIYADGSFSPLATLPWLQSASLSGSGVVKNLTPTPSLGLRGAVSFVVRGNKVFYVCCDLSSDIYRTDLNTLDTVKLTPTVPASWSFPWNSPIAGSDHFAVIAAVETGTTPMLFRGYVMAEDGASSIELPPNQIVDSSVVSDNFILLQPTSCLPDMCQRQGLQPKTKTLINLPLLKGGVVLPNSFFAARLFLSQDESVLYGSKIIFDGRLQAIAISTADGSIQELCPGLTSTQMVIKEIADGTLNLVTYEASKQSVQIYIKPKGGDCKKVNAVAVSEQMDTLQQVVISPDQKDILVLMGRYGADPYIKNAGSVVANGNQLFYVPLNGRISYLVTTPLPAEGSVSEAYFLKDSRRILFVGDQTKAGEKNIYLWSAP